MLPGSEEICIGVKGHGGTTAQKRSRQFSVKGKEAMQTSQQNQRANPPTWMPIRGLNGPSGHQVRGRGSGAKCRLCPHCPALRSLEPKAPGPDLLRQSASETRGAQSGSCPSGAFTPWPLINTPAPILTSLHSPPSLYP